MIRRASTLIETILYVAMFAAVTGVLLSFTINLMTRAGKIRSMIEVDQNAQFAMEKIAATIRNSKDATVPADGGGSGPTLTLTMPDASVSPTIFAVTNGVLTMQQGTGPALPLTSAAVKVTGLNFRNLVDPVAHARTSPSWIPCKKEQYNGWWFGVCCFKGKDKCWDVVSAWIHVFVLHDATLGSCLVATAAKSVIRYQMTVSSPVSDVGAEWSSMMTFYGTATIPRQN